MSSSWMAAFLQTSSLFNNNKKIPRRLNTKKGQTGNKRNPLSRQIRTECGMHTQEGRSCLDVLQMAGSEGVHLTQGFKEGDGTSLAGGARDVEDPAPWAPSVKVQHTAPCTCRSPFPFSSLWRTHLHRKQMVGDPAEPRTDIFLGTERMGKRGSEVVGAE